MSTDAITDASIDASTDANAAVPKSAPPPVANFLPRRRSASPTPDRRQRRRLDAEPSTPPEAIWIHHVAETPAPTQVALPAPAPTAAKQMSDATSCGRICLCAARAAAAVALGQLS